ncbi:tetratricopeptide repeat protein [Pontibacter sp. 172403-2]|uniref:tetratricopeptide repeat protein n=1 Tax=Pontibacter rufus TaxID=2791028 RepID=UPI0018AFC984|nr:tetratricopeptide repeat protein [Pontibacter sp. 172403-2]MBF9255753.1 tetratricopeptide repeat protein [Pontibacter sp. 172403-2]
MKCSGSILVIVFALLVQLSAAAQTRFLAQAPADRRLPLLWQYCSDNLISDWNSTASHQFLEAVAYTADSLGDEKLKSYAQYFQKCSRILFSERYEQHFPVGNYRSVVAVLAHTKAWAKENNYLDIAAACEHVTGGVYFRAARYGEAFEHLLKAQKAFQEIGYGQVPNASGYLFELGLCYYQFEELDKALASFLAAIRFPFYIPRMEINTLNTIGLIYSQQKDWGKAKVYYRKTIAKAAACQDKVWVGIGMGNLGQALLAQDKNDSALVYLRRSYKITSDVANRAPEDAAYSSLAMAKAFWRQQQPDSAWHYIRSGRQLARNYIRDSTESLEYRWRLLSVLVELNQAAGNYQTALQLSDSLNIIKDSLQQSYDARILSRATNKVEVERYQAELKLLESQKNLNQLRFYLLIGTVLAITVIMGLLFHRFRMRKKRQMELAEKELRHAEELLEAYLNALKEKTTLVESLTAELHQLPVSNNPIRSNVGIKIESLISSTILTEEAWQHFRRLFEQVYPGFLYSLKGKFPDLSPAETRLLILTKLNLSTRDMAHTLGISVDSIRKARYRLRKKFNLEEEAALDVMIQNI